VTLQPRLEASLVEPAVYLGHLVVSEDSSHHTAIKSNDATLPEVVPRVAVASRLAIAASRAFSAASSRRCDVVRSFSSWARRRCSASSAASARLGWSSIGR
jgi:hypothetical protein